MKDILVNLILEENQRIGWECPVCKELNHTKHFVEPGEILDIKCEHCHEIIKILFK